MSSTPCIILRTETVPGVTEKRAKLIRYCTIAKERLLTVIWVLTPPDNTTISNVVKSLSSLHH